jgi:hypothetical protein
LHGGAAPLLNDVRYPNTAQSGDFDPDLFLPYFDLSKSTRANEDKDPDIQVAIEFESIFWRYPSSRKGSDASLGAVYGSDTDD